MHRDDALEGKGDRWLGDGHDAVDLGGGVPFQAQVSGDGDRRWSRGRHSDDLGSNGCCRRLMAEPIDEVGDEKADANYDDHGSGAQPDTEQSITWSWHGVDPTGRF